MPVDVLLGLQWGDEGKGKIVDVFGHRYDIVARYQGGPNAGHTLVIDGVKHVFHQIPSGIFHAQARCLIGGGVVLNPITLQEELLRAQTADATCPQRLYISTRAHLIVPTHPLLDKALEQRKGADKIGSTLRGISPTYRDKVGRVGLRVADVLAADFDARYRRLLTEHQMLLDALGFAYTDQDLNESAFLEAIELLRQMQLVDGAAFVHDALDDNQRILAEGAQGTLLDIDFGSYPYVTASNTITGGACTGLGVPPSAIDRVYGVFKAYCTRVGSGPFPTELHGVEGQHLRQAGHEFGATTGRPRRCGWLDLPLLRYAVRLNGVTDLVMTKADVLCDMPTVAVCTHYTDGQGRKVTTPPVELTDDLVPQYQQHPGWAHRPASDPAPELRHYIRNIETVIGVPLKHLSFGPDRNQFAQLA